MTRALFVNWTNKHVGGIESYLQRCMKGLTSLGHEVALLSETTSPADRRALETPAGAPTWVLGPDSSVALASLEAWRPDVLYSHGLLDPANEERLLDLGYPTVFFAHTYYGTCISGSKTFTWPSIQPCTRRFGLACLPLHVLRSGGRNPIGMLRQFDLQRRRLAILPRYDRVITHSAHMRDEYLRHGLAPDRLVTLAYGVSEDEPEDVSERALRGPPWRLVFVGRLDRLKGCHLLIEALPRIAEGLGHVELTVAGDGPERQALERAARAVMSERIAVRFDGWVGQGALAELYRRSDVLMVPSLLPEPFGNVGPEAGRFGVPAVAFEVGGIPAWLDDGVNGRLARKHADARSLAEAAIWCMSDVERFERLRAGAVERSARFSVEAHCRALAPIFEAVVREDPRRAPRAR